ncbi:MAG: hypothetical protein LBT29_03550 [Flavobacteriaceae bacterium]|nr:hypothetical protein [Flavobacteriaceae bacterium]
MKRVFTLMAALCLSSASLYAQSDDAGRLGFSAGLQSNQLFRGLPASETPVVVGDVNIALDQAQHLKLGAVGAMAFTDDETGYQYREINYYLNYAVGGFSVGFWDVLTPDLFNGEGSIARTWNYKQETTGHRLEIRASYVISEQTPLKIFVSPAFYGNDRYVDGVKDNGEFKYKQRWSTYVELSYPVISGKAINLGLFCGMGLGLAGESHMYGNGKNDFDFTNVGFTVSKGLRLSEAYTLPVSATLSWNPSLDGVRAQVAATIF